MNGKCKFQGQLQEKEALLRCFLSEVDVIDQARLLSCSRTHANAWIRLKSRMGDYHEALARDPHVCCACSEHVMDIFGLHASVCSASGDRIKRHNAIRDSFFLFSCFAVWAPIKEKPFIFPGSPE